MKIIDRYIIRKFVGTLVFMLGIISALFIVIDLNEKYTLIRENGFTIFDAFQQYYPFYLMWAVFSFFSILIFIACIYFTSQMSNKSEIVAIHSSGVSFNRLTKPYWIVSGVIAAISLLMNHFGLPWANIRKNEFEIKIPTGRIKDERMRDKKIAAEIAPNEFVFVESYSRISQRGNTFYYLKLDSNRRLEQEIIASDIAWIPSDTSYRIYNFYEKKVFPNGKQTLRKGTDEKLKFNFTPDELLPEAYVAETMNSIELNAFIDKEIRKGSASVDAYKLELYQRTSLPISIIVLTFLGLTLASKKKRGGIGLNLALGLVLAFVYLFSFTVLKNIATKSEFPPLLAVSLPNIVFGAITAWLYIKRVRT